MSTDQADRAIAAIDAVLTDDQIDDIVDWQLSRYDERTGYDYNVGQAPCGHCAREEHGLAITERIEHMRLWGEYDEDYRYDEDTSPIICPGTCVPGPVGFRRAYERDRLTAWWPADDTREYVPRIGEPGPHIPGAEPGFVSSSTAPGAPWIVQMPNPWARLGATIRRFNEAFEEVFDPAGWLDPIADAVERSTSTPVTVRLIDSTGRPVRLGLATGTNCHPTERGFRVDVVTTLTARHAIRQAQPLGGRLIVEGPGGPRERISGTVVDYMYTPANDTILRIETASEHHHLPSVYAEPEETR